MRVLIADATGHPIRDVVDATEDGEVSIMSELGVVSKYFEIPKLPKLFIGNEQMLKSLDATPKRTPNALLKESGIKGLTRKRSATPAGSECGSQIIWISHGKCEANNG